MTAVETKKRSRTPRDPNTLANYHVFVTRHTVAEFAIDFEAKVLKGVVELVVEGLGEEGSREVVLDTRYVFFVAIYEMKGAR